MPYVVTDECIQCGVCIAGCSSGAAQEGEGKSYIDPSICIECGLCAENCPVSAIIYVEEEAKVADASASAGETDTP